MGLFHARQGGNFVIVRTDPILRDDVAQELDSRGSDRVLFGEELFNDWGGRGYDDSVPREVNKTASSGDRTT